MERKPFRFNALILVSYLNEIYLLDFMGTGKILLDKYNAIYFSIAKVACTSLKTVFASLLNISYEGGVHSNVKFQTLKKSDIKSKYQNYFKFCFVRNPWDRIVSCYISKVKDGVEQKVLGRYGSLFYGGMSFEEFVKSILKIPENKSNHHFALQLPQITDDKGIVLVDFIGKCENINSDFKYVSNKMGINIELPHLNKSDRKHYREFYNDETKELVAKRYKKDIDFFEYSF